jgi:hypothetical protein
VVSWRKYEYEKELDYQERIFYLISQVMVFYQGAITYHNILEMPPAELNMLIKARNKIIIEQNNVL